jgi:hypothetical protein
MVDSGDTLLEKPNGRMSKPIFTGLCALLLIACAASSQEPAPALQIEGLIIENQTEMWVSAARLLVPATGGFVSCGNISPQSMCSTRFPERGYSGDPVEFTWSQGGQIHSTGQFTLEIAAEIDRTRPVFVHVVIAGPGSAGAMFVQREE